MSRKWAYLRDGEEKALIAEEYFTMSGVPLVGKWLDVPYPQKVEEGMMHLTYKGEYVRITVDDIMFHSKDLFFV